MTTISVWSNSQHRSLFKKPDGYYSDSPPNRLRIMEDPNLSHYLFSDAHIDKNTDPLVWKPELQEEQAQSEDDAGSLHGLLYMLMEYERRNGKKIDADFIASGEHLKHLIYPLLGGPSAHVDIYVRNFDGQIFIRAVQKKHCPLRYENRGKICSCGKRMQEEGRSPSMTINSSYELPFWSKQVVRNGPQYMNVARAGVGEHKMVIGVEADGILASKELKGGNLKHYVELGVCKERWDLDRRLFFVWLHCFVVGIDRITIGFRDDSFKLVDVQEYRTIEILQLFETSALRNDCNSVMNWYGEILKNLSRFFKRRADDFCVYKLNVSRSLGILMAQDCTWGYDNDIRAVDDFIPGWFREWRQSLKQPHHVLGDGRIDVFEPYTLSLRNCWSASPRTSVSGTLTSVARLLQRSRDMVIESELSPWGSMIFWPPEELGYYSTNVSGELKVMDDSNLSYYYLPDADIEKHIDLSAGARKFQDEQAEAEDDTGSLHGLLQTLMEYERRKSKKVNADIIAFRGQVKRLIHCAFGGHATDVDMYVMSFDGQLFIRAARKKLEFPTSPRESWAYLAYYSGYKFERMALLDRPVAETPREVLESRGKQVVRNGPQYRTVMRTGVGEHKLVLGAEIDGIIDFREPTGDNLKHYVELKVCQKNRNFSEKLFSSWLQCFLVGINRVIIGFRDEKFVLKSVEEFSTSEIPHLLKGTEYSNVCVDAIEWYGALTKWLCELPRGPEDDFKLYRLSCSHGALRLRQLHDEDLANGDDIIPGWFREWRRSLNST
ncbi:FAFR262Cp [Eremothecium gossypii FDAG1]|nr:FAFR262Cp [Eremothecium gossypii FDAG1]